MPDEDDIEEQPSLRPFWSGTISFGLVSIPVDLYAANRTSHIGLRMLGPQGEPLRRRYYSSKTGRELEPDQMVRGYEIDKGRYVVVTDEELDKLAPEKSQDIDLRRFVKMESIPPLYFERGYFLAPAEGSTKAYQLLAAVLEKSGRAGIATFVMRGKEYLMAIVAEKGILRAETMRFKDEIRTPDGVGLPKPSEASQALVHKFEQIIGKKSERELSRDELHDKSSELLLDLVKRKRERKVDVVESDEAGGAPFEADVVDELKKRFGGHPGARSRRAPRNGAGSKVKHSPRRERSGNKRWRK